MTRDPAEAIVTRLLDSGRVVICTTCGAADAPTTDGRRRHQMLHGHQLSGSEREEGR